MVVLTESPAIDETVLTATPPVGTEELTTWLSLLPAVESRDWDFPTFADSSPATVFRDDDIILSDCDDVRAVAVLARVSRPACGLFKSSGAANTSLTSEGLNQNAIGFWEQCTPIDSRINLLKSILISVSVNEPLFINLSANYLPHYDCMCEQGSELNFAGNVRANW